MGRSEFSVIDDYFTLEHGRDDVVLGVGDDAALLRIPAGQALVTACESLGGGGAMVDLAAATMARRVVAGAAAKLALEGASPAWLTLSVTLPEVVPAWLTDFRQGIEASLRPLGLALVGGDTCHGPLRVTAFCHGLRATGSALPAGARPNDLIYVSAPLGMEGLALLARQGDLRLPGPVARRVYRHLDAPQPVIVTPCHFDGLVSAVALLDDGLSAALERMLAESGFGAIIYPDQLPAHPEILPFLDAVGGTRFLVSAPSGLSWCWTIPVERQEALETRLSAAGLEFYWVGMVSTVAGLQLAGS